MYKFYSCYVCCSNQSQAEMESSVNVFHQVEGLALVMLCNCRQSPRRLGIHILREIKCLFKLIGLYQVFFLH